MKMLKYHTIQEVQENTRPTLFKWPSFSRMCWCKV